MVRLIGVLTLTCLISALGLAYIHKLTEEEIAGQKRLAKLRAVETVLPPFDNDPVKEKKEIKIEGEKITFYIGKKEGKVVGVAFLQEGEGYSGFIKVMLGITPKGEIGGVEILEHLETPGLGARIGEPQFKAQFKGKSLTNSQLVERKLAVTKDGGDVEALTGATISPRGVVEAINKGLKIFKEHKEKIIGR